MTPPIILPLNSSLATLSTTGGKAQNLAKLAQAGLPVPPGFIVTTAAYQAFVAANDLHGFIHSTSWPRTPTTPPRSKPPPPPSAPDSATCLSLLTWLTR